MASSTPISMAMSLKPVRKLNIDLIVEEWDNLQRIFVSLALKTTTQSIIVHKLNSYARKNKTRQAFLGIRQYHQQPLLARFCRLATPTQERPECAQSGR